MRSVENEECEKCGVLRKIYKKVIKRLNEKIPSKIPLPPCADPGKAQYS